MVRTDIFHCIFLSGDRPARIAMVVNPSAGRCHWGSLVTDKPLADQRSAALGLFPIPDHFVGSTPALSSSLYPILADHPQGPFQGITCIQGLCNVDGATDGYPLPRWCVPFVAG